MTERDAWKLVFWLLCGPISAWALPALLPLSPTSSATFAGVSLELAGLFAVAYQIYRARQQHHATSVRAVLAESLRQMPSRIRGWIKRDRKTPTVFSSGGVGGVSFAVEKVYTWMSPPSSRPPDDQIRHLDAEVQRAFAQQRAEMRQIEQRVSQLSERLALAERDLRRTEAEHRDSIRDLAIGDTGMEAVGLFWVALGLLVSAWPAFFARLF